MRYNKDPYHHGNESNREGEHVADNDVTAKVYMRHAGVDDGLQGEHRTGAQRDGNKQNGNPDISALNALADAQSTTLGWVRMESLGWVRMENLGMGGESGVSRLGRSRGNEVPRLGWELSASNTTARPRHRSRENLRTGIPKKPT